MLKLRMLKLALTSGACAIALATAAHANDFNIPNGDLKHALDAYMKQAAVTLMYPEDEMHGVVTRGAHGELSTAEALARILRGTGFSATQDSSGIIGIVRDAPARQRSELAPVTAVRLASADHAASSVETVVVTSSKIKGDIQTVPIAITALSQEQLTSRQIAGGPDLVKEVPNLTFSKTNFSRLHHPDSRHRHASDFGDNRSGRGGRAERHPLHPQPFLRTGILRRQSGRSVCAARKARSMAATRPRAW